MIIDRKAISGYIRCCESHVLTLKLLNTANISDQSCHSGGCPRLKGALFESHHYAGSEYLPELQERCTVLRYSLEVKHTHIPTRRCTVNTFEIYWASCGKYQFVHI